jgi:hypothetical protein
LVKSHFKRIESAAEGSVGEATAEAAQTIATILVVDYSTNNAPRSPMSLPGRASNYTNIFVPTSSSVPGMSSNYSTISVARLPDFSLPKHQSSDSENGSVNEAMEYIAGNDDQNLTAVPAYEMAISPTPPEPSKPSETTNHLEIEATTSEIVTPTTEIVVTTNAATSVTTTNDTTVATELIPPLNDATNNMMMDNSQTEPSGITTDQDVDMLVGLDYGNIG